MLSLFPHLLVYGFFAPTLLRMVAACTFFYMAWLHFTKRAETAKEISIVSYETAVWATGIFLLLEVAVGVGLFIGLYTQMAALVGLIICFKIFWVRKNLRYLSPLSHMSYILLAAICLSLMATGPGAAAFDLPL
ncbi:MAG: hypothetical protein JWO43_287 [Candidatus Adlerbacteria bacterium]|nr:hypothetical protein [Candidatus Adlerbacteria bacterium]